MATLHAFDTLAYAKALTDKGYERDKAEALAEAQREFFVKELASEDFVRNEIEKAVTTLDKKIDTAVATLDNKIEKLDNKIDTAVATLDNKIEKLDNKIDTAVTMLNSKIEFTITASENRMMKTNAKMLAFAVGVMLAGIPFIQALLAKLG